MRLWSDSWGDARLAWRVLWRDPVAAGVALVTLALSIGVAVAAFALLKGGLWNPLPYPDASRLVDVRVLVPHPEGEAPRVGRLDAEAFAAWKRAGSELELLSAYRVEGVVVGVAEPVKRTAARVGGNLFAALGVEPRLGRWLREEDARPGAEPVAVLGAGLWRRRFEASPSALGRSIAIDGRSHTIVGVMPDGFFFPDREIELWLPLALDPAPGTSPEQVQTEYVAVLGRLRDGSSLERARDEGQALARRSWETRPRLEGVVPLAGRVQLETLPEVLVAATKPGLIAVFSAALLLVLIAGANLVSLALARYERRSGEMTMRAALGASRRRLACQLLVESAVLVGLGGSAGLGVAFALHHALPRWLPPDLQRLSASRFDLAVVIFAVVLTVAMAAGIWAALTLRQRRSEGETVGSRGRLRARRWLIVAEVALAVVVVVAAGLVGRSYARLAELDLGYDPNGVLTTTVALSETRAGGSTTRAATFDALLERLESHPEVEAGGAVSFLPLARGFALTSLEIAGRGGARATPQWTSPGYRAAVGMELAQGRWLTPEEHHADSSAVVVNEAFAARYLDGAAVGETLVFGSRRLRVVGKVRNVPLFSLTTEPRPAFFASYHLAAELGGALPERLSLAFRTAGDPERLVAPLREAARELAPGVPLEELRTMRATLDETLALPRFYGGLLGLFALTSLLLAAAGVYGLLSYWVSLRRRELGIRKALGASRSDLLRSVLGRGLKLVALGVALGLAAAAALTTTLRHLLYEISALDPATFLTTALLFLVTGLLACLLPALRALRLDAAAELREG